MATPDEERPSLERMVSNEPARRAHLGQPPRMPWDCRCTICGRPISRKDLNLFRTCDNWKCRRQHRAEQLELRKRKQEHDRLREREKAKVAAAIRDQAAGASGIDRPEEYTIALVPANTTPMVALARERIDTFREILAGLLHDALELPPNTEGNPEGAGTDNAEAGQGKNRSIDSSSPRQSLMCSACGVCGGDCCLGGGDRAHLDAATMRRYLETHPSASPSDAIDAYVAWLPEQVYKDSCICHGQAGCVLPRAMRSSVCLWFECFSLSEVELASTKTDPIRFFLAAMKKEGDEVIRYAFFPAEM